MSQDILSFGLDVSGFDAKKKKTLQEFIALFDQLSKYDGMKVSPVAGDGLTAFNKSLKETDKTLADIQKRIQTLNSTPLRPSVISAPAVQSINNVTRAANESAKAVKNVSNQVEFMGINATELGKNLTRTFSVIRTAAYILPGIGIAGIFTLAGEAIADVFQLITGVNKQYEYLNSENGKYTSGLEEVNRLLENQISLLNDLNSSQNLTYKKQELELTKSVGDYTGIILDKKLKIAQVEKNEAVDALKRANGNQGYDISTSLQRQFSVTGSIGRDLQDLEKAKAALIKTGTFFTGDKGDITNNLDKLQKAIDGNQKYYDQQRSIITNFYKATSDLANAKADLDKYNSDQERKLIFETAKSVISVEIDKNKKILSDARSTQEERLKAIQNIANQEKALAEAINTNVQNNNSVDPREKTTALRNQAEANSKAEIKLSEDTDKTLIEFFQRFIKAKSEIAISEIEAEAIIQEKISNNLDKSLEERLMAYSKYILLKQEIEDIQNGRDLKKGAITPFGRTTLTSEEEIEIQRKTDTRKSNIQADAEKRIFDIVTTSLDKKLKYVKDINSLDLNENKEFYLKDLQYLNESIRLKKISLSKYNEERKVIDDKNRILILDDAIRQDKENLQRLEDLRRSNYTLKIPG